jgi:amino acid permease
MRFAVKLVYKMVSAVNIGLGVGCIVIAALMAVIGGWFTYSGIKNREWSSVLLAILIFCVAIFAVINAVNLFAAKLSPV